MDNQALFANGMMGNGAIGANGGGNPPDVGALLKTGAAIFGISLAANANGLFADTKGFLEGKPVSFASQGKGTKSFDTAMQSAYADIKKSAEGVRIGTDGTAQANPGDSVPMSMSHGNSAGSGLGESHASAGGGMGQGSSGIGLSQGHNSLEGIGASKANPIEGLGGIQGVGQHVHGQAAWTFNQGAAHLTNLHSGNVGNLANTIHHISDMLSRGYEISVSNQASHHDFRPAPTPVAPITANNNYAFKG